MSDIGQLNVLRSDLDRSVLLVPHTHWDREWYWSLAGYRPRLIDLMDDLLVRLENSEAPGGLPLFWLDSQIAPVLDYLESKPENSDRVRWLIQENKLRVGPWFIQGDEHLVDGEACVRNLLLGRFYGGMFGPLQNVGYVPDQFGHTAQLPQILRKAGIDNAVFWRGVVDQTQNRLTWRGLDGSEVLVLWLENSYSCANELPEDLPGAVERLKQVIEEDRPFNADGIRLLMAGVDHSLVGPLLKQAAAALEKEWSIPVRIVGLDDVVRQVQGAVPATLPTMQGELLYSPHLYGCWSSRVYLKQANDRCCRVLEQWAEPLAAMALWTAGIDLRAELRTAWKELVLNHPHDSICGCSIDEVHRAMMTRFEIAETMGHNVAIRAATALQLSAALPGETIDVLSRSINRIQDCTPTHLTIWNPAGRARGETLLVDVVWPQKDVSGLEVRDSSNEVLLVQVIEQGPHPFRRWRPNGNPTRHVGRRFCLAIQPNKPLCAYGLNSFTVAPRTAGKMVDHTHQMETTSRAVTQEAHRSLTCNLNVLENDRLRVEVSGDGACALTHKATGRTFQRLCTLADFGEAGDSYSHITPIRDEQVLAQGGTVSVRAAGSLFGQIEVRTHMMVPATHSADKRGRAKRRVKCPVMVRYSLGAGWPYVKVEIEVLNKARHHLLRALFPTGEVAAGKNGRPAPAFEAHVASVPFASLRRGRQPVEWQQTDRGQTPLWPDGWPQLGWIDLPAEGANLAIVAPGTPHYDIEPDGTCRVHLLRTFDSLIWSWEPLYPMEEGQCLGKQRFQFALYPHIGDYVAGEVQAISESAAMETFAVLGGSFPAGLLEGSLVKAGPASVRVSALKPAEIGLGLVLRLINDSDAAVEATVHTGLAMRLIEEIDLLEQPVSASRVKMRKDGTARLPMGPYEIVTLLLMR